MASSALQMWRARVQLAPDLMRVQTPWICLPNPQRRVLRKLWMYHQSLCHRLSPQPSVHLCMTFSHLQRPCEKILQGVGPRASPSQLPKPVPRASGSQAQTAVAALCMFQKAQPAVTAPCQVQKAETVAAPCQVQKTETAVAAPCQLQNGSPSQVPNMIADPRKLLGHLLKISTGSLGSPWRDSCLGPKHDPRPKRLLNQSPKDTGSHPASYLSIMFVISICSCKTCIPCGVHIASRQFKLPHLRVRRHFTPNAKGELKVSPNVMALGKDTAGRSLTSIHEMLYQAMFR